MATFNSEFEIYFEDISPSGNVHLEKIAEWMSMGREQYFRATCPEHLKFIDGGVSMFTVGMSIAIKNKSQWADKISLSISTARIKKVSFELHFDFQNVRTNSLIANGTQKVAFIKQNAGEFSPIPKEIMDELSKH